MREMAVRGGESVISRSILYWLASAHHHPLWTNWTLDPADNVLFLRSLTALPRPHLPDASAEVRMDHVTSVRSGPVRSNQSSPVLPTAQPGTVTERFFLADPAIRVLLTREKRHFASPCRCFLYGIGRCQFKICTVYENQGPIKISV